MRPTGYKMHVTVLHVQERAHKESKMVVTEVDDECSSLEDA
jgi:hypothetical protein